MKINLDKLREASKTKPEGYLREVMRAGVVREGWLVVPTVRYFALCARYGQVGDAVAVVAKPVAAAVGLRGDCGGCAERQRRWNGGAAGVTPGDG